MSIHIDMPKNIRQDYEHLVIMNIYSVSILFVIMLVYILCFLFSDKHCTCKIKVKVLKYSIRFYVASPDVTETFVQSRRRCWDILEHN